MQDIGDGAKQVIVDASRARLEAQAWTDPANHPTALAPHNNEPAINGMTLRELVDWAEANGHALEDVQVDYADCGTHRVEMYVRKVPK